MGSLKFWSNMIMYYVVPIIIVIIIVTLVEKRNHIMPCRDEDELAGRISGALIAVIFYALLQFLISTLL